MKAGSQWASSWSLVGELSKDQAPDIRSVVILLQGTFWLLICTWQTLWNSVYQPFVHLNASFIEIIIRETAQRQLGVRLLSEATINKDQYVLCSLFVFHRRVSFGAQIPKEILHILLSHKSTSPTLDDVGNFTKKALCQASGMKDCSSTSAL